MGRRSLASCVDREAFFLIVTLVVGCLNLYIRAHVPSKAFVKPPSLDEFSVTSRVMQAFYIWACNLWKPWLLSPPHTHANATDEL